MGESQEDNTEMETTTLSNDVHAGAKEEFDIAVMRSDLMQKEALSGAIEEAVEENDSGRPVLKPEVVESYEDLNEE